MAERKKIVFLHHSLRQSGAVRQLLYIFNGLDRTRFEPIMIVQHRDKMFNANIPAGQKVYFLKEDNENIISFFLKFIAIVKKEKPLCIQTFNRRSNWIAYLASIFFESPPVFGSVRTSKLKIKWLLAEGLLQNHYEKVIVNSIATKKHLMRRAYVKQDKIALIYNGLDTNLFAPYPRDISASLRSAHRIDAGTLVVLSVGRIHWVKNLLCTIKALRRLHQRNIPFQFFYAGGIQDQDYYEEILAYIRHNNLEEYCHFIGPTDRITDYYNLCDVMVLSSFFEGLPNVLIEAMACECLALVADSADKDGVVTDGMDGFKFKKNDDDELAVKLELIASLSEADKSRIKSNARQQVMRRFSLDRMVQEFETLYLQTENKSL